MRKTELLIPAGSLDVLKTAVIYGADAVYLGGEAFGLRAKAKNFTNEEIMEGIRFAHDHGVKVYITANILAHNDDLAGVEKYFEELKEQMQKQYEYHQSILSDEAEKAKFNDRQIGYMEAYTQEFIKEKQQDVVNYILGCWPGKMAEKFAEAIGYSK